LENVESLRACEGNVIIDMTELDFMDSSGLGALVRHIRLFRDHGKGIALAGLNDNLRRLLQYTSIDKIVPMGASVEETLDLLHKKETD
jgi:anti-sigma B factor antagonist